MEVSAYRFNVQLPAHVEDLGLHPKLEVDGRFVGVVDADEPGGCADDRSAAVLVVVRDDVDSELVIVIRRA